MSDFVAEGHLPVWHDLHWEHSRVVVIEVVESVTLLRAWQGAHKYWTAVPACSGYHENCAALNGQQHGVHWFHAPNPTQPFDQHGALACRTSAEPRRVAKQHRQGWHDSAFKAEASPQHLAEASA